MDVLEQISEIIAKANAHDASTNEPGTAWAALHEIDMLVMSARFDQVEAEEQRYLEEEEAASRVSVGTVVRCFREKFYPATGSYPLPEIPAMETTKFAHHMEQLHDLGFVVCEGKL